MTDAEILRELLELADAAGLRVRPIRGVPGGEGEPQAASAVCRIRGETWVVLAGTDSVEERIAVLAEALRTHAESWLEGRWLPPAVRERLRPDEA